MRQGILAAAVRGRRAEWHSVVELVPEAARAYGRKPAVVMQDLYDAVRLLFMAASLIAAGKRLRACTRDLERAVSLCPVRAEACDVKIGNENPTKSAIESMYAIFMFPSPLALVLFVPMRAPISRMAKILKRPKVWRPLQACRSA